jgi:hypothetical protein
VHVRPAARLDQPAHGILILRLPFFPAELDACLDESSRRTRLAADAGVCRISRPSGIYLNAKSFGIGKLHSAIRGRDANRTVPVGVAF